MTDSVCSSDEQVKRWLEKFAEDWERAKGYEFKLVSNPTG